MGKTNYHWDLIAANLLFGANFSFFYSLTRNSISFHSLFILQVAMAALFFIPAALTSRRAYHITRHDAAQMLLVALLVIVGWMYMLLWGASYTTPIDAAIIATLGPAFTLLTDKLLHRQQQIGGIRTIGIICCFVGAWLLIFDKGFTLVHGSRGWGNLLVLIAVVSIAANTVIIKPQLERYGTRVVMGWFSLIGLFVALPHVHRILSELFAAHIPLTVQLELGYILLPGTILPMWLLYRGAEKLTAIHTALYRYIQPLSAGLVAHIRHQAIFDTTNITALVVIFAGIVLTIVGYRRSLRSLNGLRAPRLPRQRR